MYFNVFNVDVFSSLIVIIIQKPSTLNTFKTQPETYCYQAVNARKKSQNKHIKP